MNYATINDFDVVWNMFYENKNWFPHVRKSHIKNRLKWNQVILQDGVVIVHKISKTNRNIGKDSDVKMAKGAYQIHQIINSNKGTGNAANVIKMFFDYIDSDVFLTVRKDNNIANRFYRKVGMDLVGQISWSNKTKKGNVWKKGK